MVYVSEMRAALDREHGNLNQANRKMFDQVLKLEEQNVTEKGEKEAVVALRNAFQNLMATNGSTQQNEQILSQDPIAAYQHR
ncbi:hypothetical protein [Pedobacter sp. UC225_65]|uniref:hypothetical protein n=1 Tax=Pedobacter sp. UC225_65 TaxID=3350173 RepID=UPI00366CEF9D